MRSRIFLSFIILQLLLVTSCSEEPIPESYETIAAGGDHSLAIRTDGTLWAWGNNYSGELGDGTTVAKVMATPSLIGSGYSKIAAGFTHTLAIKNGSLWAWGSNEFGQLGIGSTSGSTTPVLVGTGYVTIAAGGKHSLAVKTDGTLWAWGQNDYQQLGNGTTTSTNVPILIGSGYASIAAGETHSLAIKTDGTLWTWGRNHGLLPGAGYFEVPVQVGTGSYSMVAAGFAHSIALKADGTLWAWGSNNLGQLGDGTNEDKYVSSPIKVLGDEYATIASGETHCLAIKRDGTLWAWGYNVRGQLGDGTMEARTTPTQVDQGYVAVAAGTGHSAGLKTDKTVWAWGVNAFQFGVLKPRKIGS